MSPFGALSTVQRTDHSFDDQDETQSPEGPQIKFAPGHQNLHGNFSFTVEIDDPQGVPDDYRIRILYNDFDVSDKFFSRAKKTYLDLTGRRLQLTFQNLRLPPNKDHQIKIVYYRRAGAKPSVAEYRRPSCPVFSVQRDVASVPGFQPPAEVIDLINFHASGHRINPNLIAGLIAEESGFNPLAISNKKAVGLTQITSVGEAEILKAYADWPRYPGLADMSYPMLKLAILNREIHAGNEWRLDPSLSIKGGVEYINHLADYWNKPEKQEELKWISSNQDDALADAILASYNAGATRVSSALIRNHKKWLEDEEIPGTLSYIRRAESFCDQFSHQRN